MLHVVQVDSEYDVSEVTAVNTYIIVRLANSHLLIVNPV